MMEDASLTEPKKWKQKQFVIWSRNTPEESGKSLEEDLTIQLN